MYSENKGFAYEKIAKEYLIKKNYTIIEENFTSKYGEIDIIAKNNETISFVEVKGRKNTSHGYPGEFVTGNKQRKIIMTAKYYIMKHGDYDTQYRFDVIEIILDEKSINYIENAFWA
jgi:putative endonuclease